MTRESAYDAPCPEREPAYAPLSSKNSCKMATVTPATTSPSSSSDHTLSVCCVSRPCFASVSTEGRIFNSFACPAFPGGTWNQVVELVVSEVGLLMRAIVGSAFSSFAPKGPHPINILKLHTATVVHVVGFEVVPEFT